jgi:hypothetical protein
VAIKIFKNPFILIVLLALLTLVGSPVRVAADGPHGGYGLGLIPSKGNFPRFDASHLNRSLAGLPNMVDLSSNLPPVGNQGYQSSCVGWAVGYYYKTFQERVERKWDAASPQHQFSPAWVYNQRATTNCADDLGMSFYDGFSIIKNLGAAPLASFPYDQSDPCRQPSQAVKDEAWQYRSMSFASVFSGAGSADLATLKALLVDGQPFAIAVPVYSSFYRVTYASPVVPRHAEGEPLYGGHAMFVVGYDDTMGGFKTVNSWGSAWGRDGFCYLSYDLVRYDAWEAWVMQDYVPVARSMDISLHAGWNLISLSLEPAEANVAEFFAPIADDLQAAYTWEVTPLGGAWKRYAPRLPSYTNTLARIDANKGIWLQVTRDRTLHVLGTQRTSSSVPLAAGWNLVAYPGTTAKPLREALAPIEGKYSTVFAFRNADGQGEWRFYDTSAPPEANTLQTVEPGKGYWINVQEPCTWAVE